MTHVKTQNNRYTSVGKYNVKLSRTALLEPVLNEEKMNMFFFFFIIISFHNKILCTLKPEC